MVFVTVFMHGFICRKTVYRLNSMDNLLSNCYILKKKLNKIHDKSKMAKLRLCFSKFEVALTAKEKMAHIYLPYLQKL